eukprot:2485336-Prymnesium_polylepis.1
MERKDLHADIDRAAVEGIILKPVCHRSGFGKHRVEPGCMRSFFLASGAESSVSSPRMPPYRVTEETGSGEHVLLRRTRESERVWCCAYLPAILVGGAVAVE